MKSLVTPMNEIALPFVEGEWSMIPFELDSLRGLINPHRRLAHQMLRGIPRSAGGIAFFTIHGKRLTKGQTLRRGGPHTDGSYEPKVMSWSGGGGWKIGENGPDVSSSEHLRLYGSETGGIVLCSNFESCLGWKGEYEGIPGVGGNCSHVVLDKPFTLARNTVYYGNNHFIHESVPVSADVHRVFARITLPADHEYKAA